MAPSASDNFQRFSIQSPSAIMASFQVPSVNDGSWMKSREPRWADDDDCYPSAESHSAMDDYIIIKIELGNNIIIDLNQFVPKRPTTPFFDGTLLGRSSNFDKFMASDPKKSGSSKVTFGEFVEVYEIPGREPQEG